MFEWPGGREKLQPAVDAIERAETARHGEHVAARQLPGLDSCEVYGGALSCDRTVRGGAMHLDTANTQPACRGQKLDFLFLRDASRYHRTGHDRSETLHREGAVDRQPEVSARVLLGDGQSDGGQLPAEIFESRTGGRAERNNGGACEERAAHQVLDFEPHQPEQVGVGEIGLGQRDYAARDFEQAADVEVLAGLRLDRLVGRDHEQHDVDTTDAGQHVLDEALVARDVHEADAQRGGELQMGEPEIDGDTAALLLFEAVGVDAGEGFDQRRFAVVDMAGGAYDDVPHALATV